MKKIAEIICCVVLALVPSVCAVSANGNDAKLVKRAERLHKQIVTIDSHYDAPVMVLRTVNRVPYDSLHVNFEKQRDGGASAVFYAVYKLQDKRDENALDTLPDWVESQVEGFQKYIDERPFAVKSTSVKEIMAAKKAGKVCAVFAVENGYVMGKDISNLKRFYDLGVRYMTLCHNNNNDICDAAVTTNNPKKGFRKGAEWNGLSPLGREVVAEMNRLGMIIDISHASDQTVEQVVELSKAPVIASHSSARTLCDNPRNLSDDLIRKIAAKGGVIQLTPYMYFVKANYKERRPFVSDFCDHIEHIRNIAGVEHVGFGSDFYGDSGLVGLHDETDIMNITVELMRRGWSNHDLALFWGGNLLRVMAEVEKVATRSKAN